MMLSCLGALAQSRCDFFWRRLIRAETEFSVILFLFKLLLFLVYYILFICRLIKTLVYCRDLQDIQVPHLL